MEHNVEEYHWIKNNPDYEKIISRNKYKSSKSLSRNKKPFIPYYKQLQDKRWINRRNQILKKGGYKCSLCGRKNNLQVHHKIYLKDKMAWEYKDKYLEVLCNECHEKRHCIDLYKEFREITKY